MAGQPWDYRVELIAANPRSYFSGGGPAPVDVTVRPGGAIRQGFGSVNRAIDRNLLNFKTGDLILTLDNTDGFVEQFFRQMGVKDRWTLRVSRRGSLQYLGVLMALGSLKFNRRNKTLQINSYGPTKMLDEASAEAVQRFTTTLLTAPVAAFQKSLPVVSSAGFSPGDRVFLWDGINFSIMTVDTTPDPTHVVVVNGPGVAFGVGSSVVKTNAAITVTTATSGSATMVINDTTGLLTGDVLHLTDQTNKEDVTVKQVTSATGISLEANLLNTYAAGSPVTISTPYYSYKTIDFLVRQLFQAAGIAVVDVRLNNSQFKKLAPTPVNISGLDLTNFAWSEISEKDGYAHIVLFTGFVPNAGAGRFKQANPDDAWVASPEPLFPGGATESDWGDWSPYFVQGSSPATPIRLADDQLGAHPFLQAQDFYSGTLGVYIAETTGAGDPTILHWPVADGINYGASDFGYAMTGVGPNTTATNALGCELDGKRGGRLYYYCHNNAGAEFWKYVEPGPILTDLAQADDAGKSYYGARYIADLDYTLALRSTGQLGPAFTITAWRGKQRLWVRPFPKCLIKSEASPERLIYPTHFARYVNGSIYMIVIADGAIQLLRTDDEFMTYTMRKLADATTKARYLGGRVKGSYYIFCYNGANPRGYYIAAPFYAGVVRYADHSGLSVAEALKNLAVLCNAVFWVDDDGQGHFVARDLLPAGPVPAADDRILDQVETQLWDQAVLYVSVSGGAVTVAQVSGDHAFAAKGIDISSPLFPNDAFAQAAADSYAGFYAGNRRFVEATMRDPDGTIFRPLDRWTIGGRRYVVYESDHDLANDQLRVRFLEDV